MRAFCFFCLLCLMVGTGLLFDGAALGVAGDQLSPMAAHAQKQTWNLKDADIRAVISAVSVLTGKNFVTDSRVQGKVTFMSQAPMSTDEIYQAFLSVLRVAGYAAISVGQVIKIIPITEAGGSGMLASRFHSGRADEIAVRVVLVNHVSAQELVPVLQGMLPPWARVSSYMPSNALILAGPAEELSRLVSVVRTMDSPDSDLTSVVPLKHASAKQLMDALNNLQNSTRVAGRSVNIAIAADLGSNSILLGGSMENVTRTRYLIHQLDRPTASSDTLVIPLNYLEAKKLAGILVKVVTEEGGDAASTSPGAPSPTGGNDGGGVGRGVSVQAEETGNAIILHGPTAVLKNLRDVVHQLDVRPEQVLVEAIIVKMDQALLNQLGIIWGTTTSTPGTPDSPGTETFDPAGSGMFPLVISNGIGFLSGTHLGMLVQALRSNVSSNILATPSIVVMNNKEASIAEGKQISIINRQYSQTGGGTTGGNEITPFNTFDRQDVTLSLKVTPQISPNNMIRMRIVQQDHSVDPTTPDVSNGQPILDISDIKTDVLVPSGDILVLGGLISHNRSERVQKVPILGDIPGLGNLFRFREHKDESQNLMVFIRPLILTDPVHIKEQTDQRYRLLRSAQIAMEEGYHVPAAAVLPLDRAPHSKVLPAPAETAIH